MEGGRKGGRETERNIDSGTRKEAVTNCATPPAQCKVFKIDMFLLMSKRKYLFTKGKKKKKGN